MNNDYIKIIRNQVLFTLFGALLIGCITLTNQITKRSDTGEILTREFIQDFEDGAEVYGWYNNDGDLIEVELKGFKHTKYKIK